MNLEEFYKHVEELGNWMGERDCEVLFKYASQLENSLIVEIGSYLGKSTKTMALASPTSKIIAIDPYIDQIEIKQGFLKNMKGLNVTLINSTSNDAVKSWNQPIDLLHVDGNHHYVKVIEDIVHFAPYVKKGGYIILHDYATAGQFPEESEGIENPDYGVIRAVELLKNCFFKEVNIESGFAVCKL